MKKICKSLAAFVVLSGLLLAGCSTQSQISKAEKLEQNKAYIKAIKTYKSIYSKNQKTEIGAAALYNAARIYHRKLKVFSESAKLYEEVIRNFPASSPHVKLAKVGIFDSPNYFPFVNSSTWIEGDSQTGGQNMRIEWHSITISTYTLCFVQKKFYAGKKLGTEIKRYYTKDNFELQETTEQTSPNKTIMMLYPFEKGKTWITDRSGRKYKLTIVDNASSVKVRAGEFNGCIKIKEQDLQYPDSFKYEYYAPEIGHILTTISTTGSPTEFRNNELISYSISAE